MSSREEHDGAIPINADYCRARERAERAAAKRAASIGARRVHQELAQAYARLSEAGKSE